MTTFDWDAFSDTFKGRYNRVRAIPGLGQNVRAITELVFACIDEAERLNAENEPVDAHSEPEKRRGRPPKDKQA